MLSQFTREHGKKALSDLDPLPKDIYPVGRLDFDSEGLLLLTNDKTINQLILHPDNHHKKFYLAQLEGTPTANELEQFRNGVEISVKGKKHQTLSAEIELIDRPSWITERNPPVSTNKPSSWVRIGLTEGKNRQVRKMTAKINHPTLRLIRESIENISIIGLPPGRCIELSKNTFYKKLNITPMDV